MRQYPRKSSSVAIRSLMDKAWSRFQTTWLSKQPTIRPQWHEAKVST